ncbi:MAG: leucine-rich repeat domain-containing protein [Mycoplasmoidaceae bacterium]|nr:leucine-rich repeat domain-containing protein [Mycoplasmoidaceae bacterium]
MDYIETESFNIKDVLDIDTIDTSTQVICQFNKYTLTASIAKISNSQIIGNIKSLHKYVEHNGILYKVTSIGDECFMNLSNLSGKLDIPNTINVIGDRAFKNTQIISLSTEQDSRLISIGNEAFADCSKLSAIDLDDSLFLNSIGSNAFLNCVNLSGSIYLSKTLYHIGNDAFANSGYFTNIYFN